MAEANWLQHIDITVVDTKRQLEVYVEHTQDSNLGYRTNLLLRIHWRVLR